MSALSSSVENEQKVDGVRALKRWVGKASTRRVRRGERQNKMINRRKQ